MTPTDPNPQGKLNSNPKIIQRNNVDLLMTKNIDMKHRRVINASDAVDARDYVTKQQTEGMLNKLITYLTDAVKSLLSFDISLSNPNVVPKTGTGGSLLVASSITDDGEAVLIDNTKSPSPANQLMIKANGTGCLSFLVNDPDSSHIFFDAEWVNNELIARDTTLASLQKTGDILFFQSANAQTPGTVATGFAPVFLIQLTDGGVKHTSTKLGFFNNTPVIQQTLSGYTSFPQSSGYIGLASGIGGGVYAGVNDLNTLRGAYENLRLAHEDLRSKILSSTLVKVP